jgi:carboxyl-terminal processing protease
MYAFRGFSLVLLMLSIASSQKEPSSLSPAEQPTSAVSPEMDRLANALGGDWDTVETMERGQLFPNGGSRKGTVHVRLASGGYTLLYEVHSNGSAGKLDGFLTIWWDKGTKLYYFLACFNNPSSPCRMRGTAHWDGDLFVNDYEFMVNGKHTKWRDTFTFTPNSHTLVAAMDLGTRAVKTVITTTATRVAVRASLPSGPHVLSEETDKLPLEERVLVASKIYRIVSTFFPNLSQEAFDLQYREYISQILKLDDRREFDLASMEFVAALHDGHTWFYDNWLDRNYGQSVGFTAYPIDEKWVVVQSVIDGIRVGDVIARIDGTLISEFYTANRKYVSASSDRDAGVSFFNTPAIYPERFTLTLDDGRQVLVDRRRGKKRDEASPKTEGRWLSPGAIAYIKVPTFHGIDTQAQALQYIREFHASKAIILDVRGNPGSGQPTALQVALMTKPYSTWTISSSIKSGVLLRDYDAAYPERSEITTTNAFINPREAIYSGSIFLLIDRACSCACEDFVMPFKIAKRAVLVGETTAGTFSFTNFSAFENGMILNVASIRHTFPDGSQFEGVGIRPDVEIHPTAQDLKQGRDVVLSKALEMATIP